MAGCSVPAAHAVHMIAPGLALTVPGKHGMHSAQPPGEKVPMGQGRHWVAPCMEYSPAPHATQLVAASAGVCVPRAQGEQGMPPRKGEAVPAGQSVHAPPWLERALCVMPLVP